MRPLVIEIGPFTVTGMGLMLAVSLFAGAWVLAEQMRRRSMDPEHAWGMLLWVAVAGVAGAKAYFLALHWREAVADPVGMAFSGAGLVWYGGLAGGVAAYWWQTRRRGLPTLRMFDLAAPAVALSYGIGRIGCFLVGENYGRPTDSWVGVTFPEGHPPSTAGYLRSMGAEVPHGVADSAVLAVHPTPLYELAAALVIFGLLWRLSSRMLAAGRVFGLFSVLYGIQRFLIEFVRVKDDRFVMGLTTSQLASILLVAVGAYLLVRRRGKVGLAERKARGPGAAAVAEAA